MCGIAGIVSQQRASLPARFAEVQRHRGPDQQGWLADDATLRGGPGLAPAQVDARVLLIHHRLSILDLSDAGRQPMATDDGRYHLVFNGEIYNYVELARPLERAGVRLRGGSDTEVLLAMLAREGVAALPSLEGMFALALYDRVARRLTLARDFFGIKPLYYHVCGHVRDDVGGQGARLAFASEIKALLELDWVRRTPDRQAIYDYLRFGTTDHRASTCFAEIRQLPPGHLLEVDLDQPGRPVPRAYWRLRPRELGAISFEDAARETRRLFVGSVARHLRADVPVGSALSGGVDSSSIVMAARELAPEATIRTFSYLPTSPALSEEPWIRTVGEAAGAHMAFTTPTEAELARDLDTLIDTQDEPFGSTSIYAQYRVFALARAHEVKVMLDGQGADEALGGYDYFAGARLAALVARAQWLSAARFAWRARKLPGRSKLVLSAGPFVVSASTGERLRHLVGRESAPSWLDRGWFEAGGVWMQPQPRVTGRDAFRAELRTALSTWLPKLLRYEDRNSMAHSVESRVPFLTPTLVEFLISLPEHYLSAPDGTSKYVFRAAMRGLVPDAILDRQDKVGFATPEREWLRGLDGWVRAALECPGPFERRVVLEQWQRVLAGEAHFDGRFWRCVNLARWAQRLQVPL